MLPHRSVPVWVFVFALVPFLMAGPAAAAAPAPARVLLQAQTAADGSVRVTATVLDSGGSPVRDAPVTFRARTAFGWLIVGEASTSKDGQAHVTVAPANAGEVSVEAGEDATARAAILVGERTVPEPQIRPGENVLRGLSPQPGLISPYPIPLQVGFLGVILGGVWATYGYVAWLLLRISQGG